LLRKTLPSDLKEIYRIRQSVSENILEHSYHDFVELAIPFIDDGNAWVWEENGIVVGEIAFDLDKSYIEVLYVDPGAEGKGIGRALLRKCCLELKKYGHKEVTLSTSPGTRAERIYIQSGWVEIGVDSDECIVFRKSLDCL